MNSFPIKIAGKGQIIDAEPIQNRSNLTQNLWRITLKNGTTTSVVYLPTKRDSQATKHWRSDLTPGNTLIFEGFLDVEKVILTTVNIEKRKFQKTMEFNSLVTKVQNEEVA